jgi:hypothetical protein
VRARVLVRGQRDLGVRSVPLRQIVGSEGRTTDFDRRFLPRSGRMRDRWKGVLMAQYEQRSLPPVELFRIGEAYFVRDGNHRVSTARQRGQAEIDAHVIELQTDVPLRAELTARDLCHIEEQSDFLEWTNLARIRCCITIEVSELGGYLDLISAINQHRRQLSNARGVEVDRDEAAADWYDQVYLPVIALVRASDRRLRHRTEADAFLAILRQAERLQDEGVDAPLLLVAEQYLAAAPRRRWWQRA